MSAPTDELGSIMSGEHDIPHDVSPWNYMKLDRELDSEREGTAGRDA